MKEYITIAQKAEDDFFEKKSQFIGYIAPVSSEEEALAFISEIRTKHRDARHNCFAYILQNGVKRCSDDGEPQGTAGVPILEVIEREGITDVAVVVTRYFGGILLGAGGLVRAYAHAAKLAVDAAQRKVMSPAVLLQMHMDYNQYGKINNILSKYTCITQDTLFTELVTMNILFIEKDVSAFCDELTELTAATVKAVELERCMGEFPL